MLVTNTTAHCFVLAGGVIIRPNAVDVVVSDTAYQADSGLNQQIDALDEGGEITITGKPADTFGAADSVDAPLNVTGTSTEFTSDDYGDMDLMNLKDIDGNPVVSVGSKNGPTMVIIADPDISQDALAITNPDQSIALGIDPFGYILGTGATFDTREDNTILQVADTSSGEARVHDYFQVIGPHGPLLRLTGGGDLLCYAFDTNLAFKVSASSGQVHIRTGTTVVADL